MSLTVCTLATGYAPGVTNAIHANRKRFCHDVFFRITPLPNGLNESFPASWHKIPMILHALENSEGVLWLDADAVIQKLLPIGDLHGDIACARDHNGWNLGVWYVERSAAWMLEDMIRMGERSAEYRNHKWWEQSAFQIMCLIDLKPEITELDGSVWNSPEGTAVKHYAGGDRSGKWNDVRRECNRVMLSR